MLSVFCRFRDSQYPGQQLSQDAMHDILKTSKWHQWAQQQGMTGKELAMSHGPFPAFDMYGGADYGAFKFGSASVERNIGACNSLVLLRYTEEPSSTAASSSAQQAPVTTPFIGRVNMWLAHTPPWVLSDFSELDAEKQLIADVSWYLTKGINKGLYNSPIVTRSTYDDINGNFWFCDDFQAAQPGLVPFVPEKGAPRGT